jgi:hypothetical protein
MLRPFTQLNQKKSYRQQIKPFNFLLSAQVAPFGHPAEVDPARFHLIAPYESDPRRWEKMTWANVYQEESVHYHIATTSSLYAVPDLVRVKTYGDVLAEYRTHPEMKSLGPDGQVCSKQSRGLLQRRPVTVLSITHVGKESNRLEEVQAGLVHDPEEVYTEYTDPEHDPWKTLVVPVLKQMPRSLLMEQTGLDRSTITRLRNSDRRPHPEHRETLIKVAATFAKEHLLTDWKELPHGEGPLEICALYLSTVAMRPREE